MTAWYNEIDPGAAATLEELIANNLIAPGVVDTRSIKDVSADDLRGFTQCHFFAGIGIWSGALRAAGWSDDRPVWTGSCPCQPFSAAGANLGFDDPRHLWPDWFRIIREARQQGQRGADTIFGEQVATAGLWLDLVRLNLEALGYAFGVVDLPAAGFAQGAHIRQRLDWVADGDNAERWSDMAARNFGDWPATGRIEGYGEPGAGGAAGGLADGAGRQPGDRHLQHGGEHRLQSEDGGAGSGLVDTNEAGLGRVEVVRLQREHFPDPDRQRQDGGLGHHHHQGPSLGSLSPDERGAIRVQGPAVGATGSLRGCDWLLCHDARIRPVEPGTFPLAPSHPGRLGALRGYGNALDFEQTKAFVAAYMEAAEIKALMVEFT